MSPYYVTASLAKQAFGCKKLPRILGTSRGANTNNSLGEDIEAIDSSKIAPTSLPNTNYKMFHILHMLRMFKWIIPYNFTASLTKQAPRKLPRILGRSHGRANTYNSEKVGAIPIQESSHFIVKLM